MPYLHKNADHMGVVLDGKIGQDMLAQIESSVPASSACAGRTPARAHYYTTKQVSSVADMKGLKIRTQNNAMMADMTNVAGRHRRDRHRLRTKFTPPSSRAPSTALKNNWLTY